MGDAVNERLNRRMEDALARSGEIAVRHIRKLIGRQCHGEHSQPWEPPKKESGFLQANIGWMRKRKREVVVGVGPKVGTANVPYAGYLEYGTRKMLPRPFLRRGVYESVRMIRRAMIEAFT